MNISFNQIQANIDETQTFPDGQRLVNQASAMPALLSFLASNFREGGRWD